MAIALVTFANLGSKHNLKTPDIAPVVEHVARKGMLGQVLCQIRSGTTAPGTVSAIPGALWYSLRLFEKVTRYSFSRVRMEKLLDYCASRRLTKHDVTLLHGGYGLPRTTARARALGSVTVDIAVSAHIATNAELETEELQSLNLSPQDGWYVTLNREVTHTRSFDYVIAHSEFVKQSYVAAGYPTNRIYVAPPDIDIHRFSPAGPSRRPGTFKVVYSAFTTTLKGLHYLLDAWRDLKLQNAELILVGGYGSIPESLKRAYNARIQSDQSITWVGTTTMPEEYYRDAAMLVFPSLTEGFGRVTLEAMACGVPVITTENARGIVEDGKTGFVVPIRDAKALAEKIGYFYDNPEVGEAMGKAARKAVEAKKPFGEAVYTICQDILQRESKS